VGWVISAWLLAKTRGQLLRVCIRADLHVGATQEMTAENRRSLINAFAEDRLQAWRERRMSLRTGIGIDVLSVDEAYEVQALFLQARERAGERVIGWKVGCTSPAIQNQFGLSQPISGRLLEPFIHRDRDSLPAATYVDCAVEAEMAIWIGTDLHPSMDLQEIHHAIAAVSPAIELHNYRFWYGIPTCQELISSNGIHAGLVLGRQLPYAARNLEDEVTDLTVNGEVKASGTGGEIMGGPIHSLHWLVRHIANRGQRVCAGDLVIPGSAVPLIRVAAGDTIESRFSSLGSCSVRLF
jgi:2-keto-4-pentenoate hydratase